MADRGRRGGRPGRRAGSEREARRGRDGLGSGRRSASASSSSRFARTAARLSGAAPGAATRPPRARCGRSTPQALARVRARSSPHRQTSSGDSGSAVADGACVGRRSELASARRSWPAPSTPRARTRAPRRPPPRGDVGDEHEQQREEGQRGERCRRADRPRQLERSGRAERGVTRAPCRHGRPRPLKAVSGSCASAPQDFLKTARRACSRRRAR